MRVKCKFGSHAQYVRMHSMCVRQICDQNYIQLLNLHTCESASFHI